MPQNTVWVVFQKGHSCENRNGEFISRMRGQGVWNQGVSKPTLLIDSGGLRIVGGIKGMDDRKNVIT